MISNEERHKAKFERRQRWNFLAVKKSSGLSRGIISKNNSDFYFLNCLHSFRTKHKLKQ